MRAGWENHEAAALATLKKKRFRASPTSLVLEVSNDVHRTSWDGFLTIALLMRLVCEPGCEMDFIVSLRVLVDELRVYTDCCTIDIDCGRR